MNADQARALFLEHCKPGGAATLQRYGTQPAVDAMVALTAFIEAEARRYAGMYPEASDGRNTFVMFADMVSDLTAARILPSDQPAISHKAEACAFVDCPPGLFRWQDIICFKSEYSSKPGQQDAYCVSSGEYFWGGTSGNLAARNALIVTPITALAQVAA